MSFCSNCGKSLTETDKFCKYCGTAAPATAEPVTPVAPAPQPTPVTPVTPVAQPAPTAVQTAPVYTVPSCSKKAKALGFVGMGLGIGGLVFAVLGILYTFIGLAVDEILGFTYAFVFGIFSMPLSIVGKILSGNSQDAGNCSAPPSVGSKLGLAGIIVTAVMLFIGFICLVSIA